MEDKPFLYSEEFFPTDCEDDNDPFNESGFPVNNNLFSYDTFPSCCNPYSNNNEMVQENDFPQSTFDSYEFHKEINDEATSFSNIDNFSKNVINHASSQFSSYASPGNFTNDEQDSSSNFQPIAAMNQASENVHYVSNLISTPSQVPYTEIQKPTTYVPHPATSGVHDCTAISGASQFNMFNLQYSFTNPLQKSSDDLQNQESDILHQSSFEDQDFTAITNTNQFINNNNSQYSFPNHLQNQVQVPPPQYCDTELQKFNCDISTTTSQKKLSRKEIYGHGIETEKLKRYENYNKPFENCAFYKAIQRKIQGNKYKDEVIIIGKKYNKDFKEQIKNKTLPKFKRDFARNLGLAVWFFEELTPYIYHWMINENII